MLNSVSLLKRTEIALHDELGTCMERLIRGLWHAFVKAVDAVFRILRIKLQEKQRTALLQFIRYGFVCISGIILGYLLYLGVIMLLQTEESVARFDYLIGNIVSWVIGVFWNFYWNRKYVFTDYDKQVTWLQSLIKCYISYAFSGLLVSNILSFLWVAILYIDKIWAPLLNLLVTFPINFLMNKFWAFRQKTEPDQP